MFKKIKKNKKIKEAIAKGIASFYC